jgi:transcriptional regulator with XRE-family HTH domain
MDQLVNMQALGERVLLVRRRAGLSQSELAQRAGVDPMTISRIESGHKKRLELETAARLAHVFGMTLDQLCGLQPTAGDESAASPIPAPAGAVPQLALPHEEWGAEWRRSLAALPYGEWGSEWQRHLAAQIYSWQHDDGISLKAIAQRLNTAGVPTRSGRGQWYQPSVSQFLLLAMPQTKKGRKEFLAKYRPARHIADEDPAPQPPAKRQRTRKAAPVG